MRTFESGATRDSDDNKLDFEGFLSPLVLERYASYMHHHRKQADGNLRDSDNWQKGMSLSVYMKSMWRHFFDIWKLHRGLSVEGVTIEEALCAVLFNSMGYLHEILAHPPASGFSNHIVAQVKERLDQLRAEQAQIQDGAKGGYPC